MQDQNSLVQISLEYENMQSDENQVIHDKSTSEFVKGYSKKFDP